MGIDTEALERTSAASRPLRVGLIAPPWLPVPPVGYGGIETIVDVLAQRSRRSRPPRRALRIIGQHMPS